MAQLSVAEVEVEVVVVEAVELAVLGLISVAAVDSVAEPALVLD